MTNIKVHGTPASPNVIRVLACLYEKEIHFDLVPVDMSTGAQKKEPHVSLNPFGQVPALEDADLTLFESRAINEYIAKAYSKQGNALIYEGDVKKNAIRTVWTSVESHQFDPPASKLAWEIIAKPFFGQTTDDAAVEEFEGQLAKVLDIYEARLAQSKYLGGDTFTLADLNHLPNIDYLMGTRVAKLFKSRPHVSAWCADIQARPAWIKALANRS